jgi:hypothetical protein
VQQSKEEGKEDWDEVSHYCHWHWHWRVLLWYRRPVCCVELCLTSIYLRKRFVLTLSYACTKCLFNILQYLDQKWGKVIALPKPECRKAGIRKTRKNEFRPRREMEAPLSADFTPTIKVSKPKTDFRIRLWILNLLGPTALRTAQWLFWDVLVHSYHITRMFVQPLTFIKN